MSERERTSTPAIDYLRPIIADGDTGHGGLTAVMKLTKMFIEKGAAGIHFEDQKVALGSHELYASLGVLLNSVSFCFTSGSATMIVQSIRAD